MRKIIILTIALAAGILITSCRKENNTIQLSSLEKGWTHSFEESIPGQFEVYRPTNYKEFPIARYRQIFNFKNNNHCDYLVLESNDAQNMKNGNWEFKEKVNNLKIYNENSDILYEYEILELRDDLLKLKTINP